MIKSIAIALTIPLLSSSVFAQAPGNPPPEQEQTFHAGPGQPPPREILESLQSMTPAQRQAFLQSHPQVNQFIQNHPDYAQHLANGSGPKNPGQARVNEVNQDEHEIHPGGQHPKGGGK